MLLSYLKLSFRLLTRSPFFSMINVTGLAVGFATFFTLWQHASSELVTDQHHKDFERIVRAVLNYEFSSDNGATYGLMTSGATPARNAPTIADDFQQVEDYTRVLQQPQFNEDLVGHNRRVVISLERNGVKELFEEERVVYTDPNFFDFFTIPLVEGSSRHVLKEARSVVLSETKANQYFGDKNPVGEFIMVNDTILLKVTGVFQDLPHATHFAFDMVVSNVGVRDQWYEWALTSTYLKLDKQTDIGDFETKVNQHIEKYFPGSSGRPNQVKLRLSLFMQPLADIAFSVPYEYDYRPRPKSKSILIILQVVSVLVLLMAWINYVNLGVSRMMKRMKEVATRKVSGAFSADFARQFLVESSMINILAIALAFTAMQLVRLPAMILFEIHIPQFTSISPETWGLFAFVVILGVLATGLYPAILSASYSPRTLFAVSKTRTGRGWIQSILTVGQYSSALVLILWAFIVYLQLNHVLTKDLGIRREQVVIVDAPVIRPPTYLADFKVMVDRVRAIPGVLASTSSISVVGDLNVNLLGIGRRQQSSVIIGMDTNGGVDEHFIPFYGIKMIAGRNFQADEKGDVLIISRYAASRVGFNNPEDAVGAILLTNTEVEGETKEVRVIGVFEDYRFKPFINVGGASSESATGRGICLAYRNNTVWWHHPARMSVRLDRNKQEETIAEIERIYHALFPGNLFRWYFLDDHINRAYDNDKIVRNQILLFTVLAIGISCLGLLAMMTTWVEEQTKEIGIRKVLGATISQIGARLLRNVYLPLGAAIVISLPAGYLLAEQFLDGYLEKISLQWWHVLVPVLMLMVIMMATISSVLLRAARANPVEALKYE